MTTQHLRLLTKHNIDNISDYSPYSVTRLKSNTKHDTPEVTNLTIKTHLANF